MQMKLKMLVFALVALTGHWGFAQETDEEQLIGQWRIIAVVVGGEDGSEMPGLHIADLQIEVGEDEGRITHPMFAMLSEDAYIGLEIELDVSQMPPHIDISLDASNLGAGEDVMVIKGIYELDENVIRVCLSDSPDGERPEEFESTAENKFLLLTLERIEDTDE